METAPRFAQIELAGQPALRVAASQTVLEALQAAQVALRQPVLVVVNGQVVDFNYQLQAGDIARLIPQIAGG